MLFDDKKENREYTAQIFPLDGKVHVQIIYTNASEENGLVKKISGTTFYAVAMKKSFGSFFRTAPREQDYARAARWASKQLELLEKHGTGMVCKPDFIRLKECIQALKEIGY